MLRLSGYCFFLPISMHLWCAFPFVTGYFYPGQHTCLFLCVMCDCNEVSDSARCLPSDYFGCNDLSRIARVISPSSLLCVWWWLITPARRLIAMPAASLSVPGTVTIHVGSDKLINFWRGAIPNDTITTRARRDNRMISARVMETSKDKNYKRSLKRIYNPEEKLGQILGKL